MKDLTLNDGTKMTDAEYIEEFGLGDAPTDFVATKDDLVSLAHGIVDDLLRAEYFLMLNVSRGWIIEKNYILSRLIRLTDYLPELEEEVLERLRLGREENDADVKQVVAEWEADAKRRATKRRRTISRTRGEEHISAQGTDTS